jgi:hypothetical protein
MTRRTHLKDWDKRLLTRIHTEQWTAKELQWTLDHLGEDTPTRVIQEIHLKMQNMRATLIALTKRAR